MVLIRFTPLLLVACSQSLFENPNGNGAGNEMPVASECTAPCVGDAGGDFDGTAGGMNGRWRYLEDRRDRTWAAMTPDGSGALMGTNTDNFITKCTPSRTEHACQSLPGALLVSGAGAAANADPAIELTAPMNQVVQISLKVAVPPGAGAQEVRLYRNSREDVLFTGMAQPAASLEHTVTIDALANDRILVALVPSAAVQYVGVQLFVSGTGAAFPQSCQVAIPFSQASGNTVDNLCGGDFTSKNYATSMDVPPTLAAGPFAEMGMAADFVEERYFEGASIVQRSGDTTTQFWVRHDMVIAPYAAWPYSELDLDNVAPGGLGVAIYDNPGRTIEGVRCSSGNPIMFVGNMGAYPADGAWHFVRVVQRGANVELCLDGRRQFTFAAPAGSLQSKYPPHLGKNVRWTPAGAFFDGRLDDVRVFTGALPCD